MTKRAFGELESQILYIIKPGTRKTVKEVHQMLGGKNSYNTIMTVMFRLFEKGQLGREKKGLQYEYWNLSTLSSSSSFFNKFKQNFVGMKTSVLVNHLIETADDLSEEDLQEMEKLLQKARSSKK